MTRLLPLIFLLVLFRNATGQEQAPSTTASPTTGGDSTVDRQALQTYEEIESSVRKTLRKDFSKNAVESEAISQRYSLVRLYGYPHEYHADGRRVFNLRVTVDKDTGEMIDVRADYVDDEISKIEGYRPPDVIKPEEAIAIAEASLRQGAQPADITASRTEIDLVGGRYYRIRFLGKPPKLHELKSPYFVRLVIDGKTKLVITKQLG